jgi:hypothetical protein
MKSILLCTALLVLAACAQTTRQPPVPPTVDCTRPSQPDPVDGGIGGTGVVLDEHCKPSKSN